MDIIRFDTQRPRCPLSDFLSLRGRGLCTIKETGNREQKIMVRPIKN